MVHLMRGLGQAASPAATLQETLDKFGLGFMKDALLGAGIKDMEALASSYAGRSILAEIAMMRLNHADPAFADELRQLNSKACTGQMSDSELASAAISSLKKLSSLMENFKALYSQAVDAGLSSGCFTRAELDGQADFSKKLKISLVLASFAQSLRETGFGNPVEYSAGVDSICYGLSEGRMDCEVSTAILANMLAFAGFDCGAASEAKIHHTSAIVYMYGKPKFQVQSTPFLPNPENPTNLVQHISDAFSRMPGIGNSEGKGAFAESFRSMLDQIAGFSISPPPPEAQHFPSHASKTEYILKISERYAKQAESNELAVEINKLVDAYNKGLADGSSTQSQLDAIGQKKAKLSQMRAEIEAYDKEIDGFSH
ncbi:MAG: hypothetical protein WC717_00095 [Candidatus Micrarchaeia archaeon]|jgi:hypothetical protein